MFELQQRRTLKITPEFAEKLLNNNTYLGQRPVRRKHLETLKDAINTGRFLTGDVAIGYQGWNGGDAMLANGQHQCLAVIETGKPITAVVEEYKCKTPEEFADLYRQFDNNAVRSLAEIAIPEAAALNLKWSKDLISKVLSAISLLENHKGLHKNKRIEFLKKYIREGNFIYEITGCVKQSDIKHMMRSPVIAAMIVTFRKCNADAEAFWELVRDGENLIAKNPAFKLRNYLLSTSISLGRGVNANSLNASASVKEIFSKCITAWNAYRTDGETSLRYYPNKGIPKVA